MDMINELVHITIGISRFDVLMKEVGREAFRLNCYEEANEKSDYSCEQRRTVAERECTDTDLRSARDTKSAVFNNQVADVVMGELRKDGEDKGRPNNSKMSKKDREGSLDPASSINRFSDIGLGLESESGLMEIEHSFHDRDGHTKKGSTTSVQEAASVKLALETGAEKIEGDRIGVEGGKLKTGHGKGGSTWQGKCVTLMPPMLGREIEEELVAENQAATLPTVILNGGTGGLGVYVDDDGAKDVDEETRDRDDIVNNSGMHWWIQGGLRWPWSP
ncbi:hypothetical protein AHAS_Ahas11G0217300 [Arachis hypogaea]